MFGKSENSQVSLFARAFADEHFALELYKQKPEQFKTLTVSQRARLAHRYFSLVKAMILNSHDDDVGVLTYISHDPEDKNLEGQPPIMRDDPEHQEIIAMLLSINSPMFQNLSVKNQVIMAIYNNNLISEMVTDKSIYKLSKAELSKLAAYLALNNKIFLCKLFAKDSLLFSKINPAALLLLTARLKNSTIDLEDLPVNVVKQIKHAFNLPLNDQSNQNGNELTLIIALADESVIHHPSSDLAGLFHQLLKFANGQAWLTLDYDEYRRAANVNNERIYQEALALILIQDRFFIEGVINQNNPSQRVAELTTAERIALGERYPRIAVELLTNPSTQGRRVFTDDECAQLILAHPGRSDISNAAIYFSYWKDIKQKLAHDPFAKLDTKISYLYEQLKNIQNSKPVTEEVPSLRTMAAFSFFRTKKTASLPKELKEEVESIKEFMKTNFGV